MFCQIAANAIDGFMGSRGHFTDVYGSGNGRGMSVGFIITSVIWMILVLVLGKWLWNTVLCKVVTVATPMPNILYFFGLVLLVEIIRPSL